MAHYLLKKRIMMQLEESEKQQSPSNTHVKLSLVHESIKTGTNPLNPRTKDASTEVETQTDTGTQQKNTGILNETHDNSGDKSSLESSGIEAKSPGVSEHISLVPQQGLRDGTGKQNLDVEVTDVTSIQSLAARNEEGNIANEVSRKDAKRAKKHLNKPSENTCRKLITEENKPNSENTCRNLISEDDKPDIRITHLPPIVTSTISRASEEVSQVTNSNQNTPRGKSDISEPNPRSDGIGEFGKLHSILVPTARTKSLEYGTYPNRSFERSAYHPVKESAPRSSAPVVHRASVPVVQTASGPVVHADPQAKSQRKSWPISLQESLRQELLGTKPVVQQTEPLNLAIPPSASLPNTDFIIHQLAEQQEKSQLIARILEIVRNTMSNPALGLNSLDSKTLAQCANLMGSPLNSYQNLGIRPDLFTSNQSMGFPFDSLQKQFSMHSMSSIPPGFRGPPMEPHSMGSSRNPAPVTTAPPLMNNKQQSLHLESSPAWSDVSSRSYAPLQPFTSLMSQSTGLNDRIPLPSDRAPLVRNEPPTSAPALSDRAPLPRDRPPLVSNGPPTSIPDQENQPPIRHSNSERQLPQNLGYPNNSERPTSPNHRFSENSSNYPRSEFNRMYSFDVSREKNSPTDKEQNWSNSIHDQTSQDSNSSSLSHNSINNERSDKTLIDNHSPVTTTSPELSQKSFLAEAFSTKSIPSFSTVYRNTGSSGYDSQSHPSSSMPPITALSSHMPHSSAYRPPYCPQNDDTMDSTRTTDSIQTMQITSSCSPNDATRSPMRRKRTISDMSLVGYPVTSSGRNKGQGKLNEPKFDCQVCGDIAAGFHCGAYVCEACKKFYLRCLKNDVNLLSCPKNQHCEINKENRSHCQYCRYQKCIYLGMYRPGREYDKQLKVDFKSIPCKICCAASSGFHFGAITCEGCKGFFRRMLKENLHQKFTCSSGRSCEITSANRTFCKSCRFDKCVRVGMTLEGTRLGRQSNSIKRNTLIAYQMKNSDGPTPPKIMATGEIKQEPQDEEEYGTRIQPNYSTSLDNPLDIIDLDDVAMRVMDDLDFTECSLDATDSVKRESSHGLNMNLPGLRNQNDTLFRNQMEPQFRNHPRVNVPSVGDRRMGSYERTESDFARNAQVDLNKSGANDISLNTSHQYTPSTSGNPTPVTSSGFNSNYFTYPSITPSTNHSKAPMSANQHSESPPMNRSDPVTSCRSSPSTPTTPSAVNLSNRETGPSQAQPKPNRNIPGMEIYSDSERLIEYLLKIYKLLDNLTEKAESQTQYKLDTSSLQSIWQYNMLSFVHDACYVLKYLKAIPGFREMPSHRQVELTQETFYPICLLFHARRYHSQTKDIKFFAMTDEERDLFFAAFPVFKKMQQHFFQCGEWVAEYDLDEIETALLTCILVLTVADRCVMEKNICNALEEMTLIFMDYCDTKDSSRAGLLLAKIAELKRSNLEHQDMALIMKQQYCDLDLGPLWMEIFVMKKELEYEGI